MSIKVCDRCVLCHQYITWLDACMGCVYLCIFCKMKAENEAQP